MPEEPADASDNSLPAWFCEHLQPLHTNFEERVVCLGDDERWLATSRVGVEMRIMEYVPGTTPRVAAQLRFSEGHDPVELANHPDLEILIQKGELTSQLGSYDSHWYFRIPDLRNRKLPDLSFERAATMDKSLAALIYIAIGQMKQSDTEWRRMDTQDEENWFPGPVDGTDVMPLHGHGSGNVMLVRWNRTAAFKTRIDPRGEELLVLNGAVYDAQGYYPEGSWIRNPIKAWQAWGAKAGTVAYYKNGHFAHSEIKP